VPVAIAIEPEPVADVQLPMPPVDLAPPAGSPGAALSAETTGSVADPQAAPAPAPAPARRRAGRRRRRSSTVVES
jgi:hypothetical protein